jgi:hypothetical protein
MKRAAQSASSRIGNSTSISGPGKLREVMVIAEEQGLLSGERNQVVRGSERFPLHIRRFNPAAPATCSEFRP